jgi:hypothetical protein
MARINVSVPDSLRERMSALDQQVNWSEVAQLAFEREIIAHNNLEIEDMEQVIERLKVSKAEHEKAENELGKKEGHEWACRVASYGDLKKVSDLELVGSGFATQFDEALGNDWRNRVSFWIDEETGRVRPPSDEYVFGFWDAADDVFAQVENKL